MRMSKAEQDMYLAKSAIAVYPMTNHGGIEILEIDEETVVYRWSFGDKLSEAHKAKIRYGKNHSSFKTSAGYSIRLDECVSVYQSPL